MMAGYSWTQTEKARRATWHYFRNTETLCGTMVVDDLTEAELEPAPVEGKGRHYCQICARMLRVEAERGLPPEPALSVEEKKVIGLLWPTHTASQIAEIIGRENVDRVKFYAKRFGGLKEIPNAGIFKKGQMPHNHRPDETEFLRKDQRGVFYWHVRGGKFGFQYKHIWLWEQAHGPVPDGHCVFFKDRDTLNCVLENLGVMTKADNLERNNGRAELTDEYVARTIGQSGYGHVDEYVVQAALQTPELLELKRNQLRLKRAIQNA